METNMAEQMSLFEASYDKPTLPKHVRLIEFFAGIGAQAKALEILGADFEHWRTCEWSINSIIAYDAIHIKDFKDYSANMSYEDVLKAINGVSADYNKPMDDKQLKAKGEEWARKEYSSMVAIHDLKPNICDVHSSDLGIVDQNHNTYVMTYSFPCQSLSKAGKMEGMSRERWEAGNSTRSGLLWEVERILNECKKDRTLPQVLLMENVPDVCGSKNIIPWNQWLDALQKLGYTNYFKVLNSKNYGIPQNRQRCFMVSLLGEYSFSFPSKLELKYRLKNFTNSHVDEKYYLSDNLVKSFKQFNKKIEETLLIPTATKKGYMEAKEGDGCLPTWKGARGTVQKGMSPTIMTSPDTIGVMVKDNFVEVPSTQRAMKAYSGDSVGITFAKSGSSHTPVTHQISRTITTFCDHDIGIVVKDDKPKLAGSLNKYNFAQADSVYSKDGISPSIMAYNGGQNGHQIQILDACVMKGNIKHSGFNDMTSRCYGTEGLAPSVRTFAGGNTEIKIVDEKPKTICLNSKVDGKQPSLNDRVYSDKGVSVAVTTTPFFMGNVLEEQKLRIRKLTEGECYRLMGFEEKDTNACKEVGQSVSTIYHQAGDSIVTTCLIGIFGELLGFDYKQTINNYVKKLAEECKQ